MLRQLHVQERISTEGPGKTHAQLQCLVVDGLPVAVVCGGVIEGDWLMLGTSIGTVNDRDLPQVPIPRLLLAFRSSHGGYDGVGSAILLDNIQVFVDQHCCGFSEGRRPRTTVLRALVVDFVRLFSFPATHDEVGNEDIDARMLMESLARNPLSYPAGAMQLEWCLEYDELALTSTYNHY
jgi:hypothetical protein